MNNWTAIYETTQPYQAEMIKDILHDNGVEAVVLNQKDSSYTTFGTVRVMVPPDLRKQAEEIIKTIECE